MARNSVHDDSEYVNENNACAVQSFRTREKNNTRRVEKRFPGDCSTDFCVPDAGGEFSVRNNTAARAGEFRR